MRMEKYTSREYTKIYNTISQRIYKMTLSIPTSEDPI